MPSMSLGESGGGGGGLGYVRPNTVGYLGAASALTPYSPAASGLPGAGNAPPGCVWQADGLHCTTVTNMILDHVYIYGGITFTGSTLTITNSIIQAGTGTEYWCIRGAGMPAASAGGCVTLVDCTVGWGGPNLYPSSNDTAFITDNSGPLYNFVRLDIGTSRSSVASGFPQGINPASGTIDSCWIHNVYQVNPGLPTHLDGIFMQGGINLAIQHCYIDTPYAAGAAVTGAFFSQSGGGIPGVIIDSNFLQGGSFTLYNENCTNLVVTNNTFGQYINGYAFNVNADGGTIAQWYNNVNTSGQIVPNPYLATIPMTVTAQETGSTANGISMAVKVLDNCGGAGASAGFTQISPSAAITPLNAGSLVIGSQLGLVGTYTVIAGTTADQNIAAGGVQTLAYHSTASPVQGTPTTYGFTATANSISQVLAELIAKGGTLAVDAATPAAVTATAAITVTTASFTVSANPNTWLVAAIQSNGGAAATTMQVTDTSGLGLTWTEVVRQNTAGDGYSGIWVAQVIIP